MSRPSSSVPSRCSSEGGSNDSPDALVTVSNGPTRSSGKSAITVNTTMMATPSTPARSRPNWRRVARRRCDAQPPALGRGRGARSVVGRGRRHVRTRGSSAPYTRSAAKLASHDADGQDQEEALHHRVVAGAQRVDGQRAQARPREDLLDGDGAGHDVAEVDGDERDRRQEGVGQDVLAQDPGVLETLGLGRRHVVLGEDLVTDERIISEYWPIKPRATVATGRARCQSDVEDLVDGGRVVGAGRGHAVGREPVQRRGEDDEQDHPEPEIGHRVQDQRRRRSQGVGRLAASPAGPRPRHRPTTMAMTSPTPNRSRVGPMRSPMTSATDRPRNWNDRPRSSWAVLTR